MHNSIQQSKDVSTVLDLCIQNISKSFQCKRKILPPSNSPWLCEHLTSCVRFSDKRSSVRWCDLFYVLYDSILFHQMFEFLGRLLHWVLRIWVENSQVESEWKQSWLLLEKRFISTHICTIYQVISSCFQKGQEGLFLCESSSIIWQ